MYDIKEGQAGWDQRVAFHQRLDKIIQTATRDAYNNDLAGWRTCLLFLKISLSPHMKEEEKTKANNLLKKLGTNNIPSNNSLINIQPYIDLQELLHQVMRNKGFDVPIGDEDGSL